MSRTRVSDHEIKCTRRAVLNLLGFGGVGFGTLVFAVGTLLLENNNIKTRHTTLRATYVK